MKVILIPDETSGRSSRSLSPEQVRRALLGIVGLGGLAVVAVLGLGALAWLQTDRLDQAIADRDALAASTATVAVTAAGTSTAATNNTQATDFPEGASSASAEVTADSTPSRTLVGLQTPKVLESTLEAVEASDKERDRVQIVARAIANIRHDLVSYRDAIRDVRNENDTHLSVLGARIGELHAHVMRLDALGARLTDVANLSDGEFNFDHTPAIGGTDQEDTSDRLTDSEALLATLDLLDADLAHKDSQLEVLEALIRDQKLEQAQYPAAWPAEGGWISSNFGKRRDPFSGRRAMHKGIDIAGRSGSFITAAAAGVVTHTGHTGNYGLMVEINHGNGYITRYGHASEILVKVGEKVDKGGAVAKMGSTGRSTGPHLHFEVIEHAKHVDPRKFLGNSG